jgi:hypothetical protein
MATSKRTPAAKPRGPKTAQAKAAAVDALKAAGQADVARAVKKAQAQSIAAKKTNSKKPEEKMTRAQLNELGASNLAKGRAKRAAAVADGSAGTTLGDGTGNSVPAVKQTVTAHKLRLMATTGMTPLEFLTAVYRDQLYQDYDVEVVDEAKGLAQFFPKVDPVTGELATSKVELKIEQRIAAATSAAPYVHRKKPIGIDGGEGKPLAIVTADKLATLSDGELDKLLTVFGKLGVGAEFEGHAQRPYGIEAEDQQ